jgi:imidazolonepropionase
MSNGEHQHADLVFHSANQLLTIAGAPQRGKALGSLEIVEDGAIAIRAGKVVAVGLTDSILTTYAARETIDASGRVLMPGFVDPHTHLVWAGDRSAEFEMRIAGATYMEIMAEGGGIAATVRETRAASIKELKAQSLPRITRMLAHGTTTAEAKSGYGLSTASEIKLLQAIVELDLETHLQIIPTFLGAHALPMDWHEDGEAGYETYSQHIIGEMLPGVFAWWEETYPDLPLPFVDVFCEQGAFSLDQSTRILTAAQTLGFPLKIHADEFVGLGGTRLAVQLGAISADHLVQIPPDDISAIGASTTVAVALPGTPFGLAEETYTPAQKLLEQEATLALATDLNPGTSWCESMQMVIALACRYMELTPAQAIAAATINGAAAIGLEDQLGSLEVGKQADLILLDVPDYRHLGYRYGTNLVGMTVKCGQIVYTSKSFMEI